MRLVASSCAALSIAALLVVARIPAQAAVSAAALTAATATYAGACPTTMAFAGTITGTPGTTFQYSFNRFVNGVQQVHNVGPATLPASGTLAVNDSFGVSTSSTGINFDQVWVHNVSGGQADAYSNKASFSVTCGAATPAPSTSPGGTPTPSGPKFGRLQTLIDPDDAARNPASPGDIKTSGDPKACAAHMANPLVAGLLCQPIAAAGKLFILWTWHPHAGCFSCPQDVDGFKIYQTDASRATRTYLTETSAGPGATVSVLNNPPGGFVGKCYSVSAYKGAKESTLGQATCITSAPAVGATTVTLPAAKVRSSTQSHYEITGAMGVLKPDSDEHSGRSDATLMAGFYHNATKEPPGDTYANGIVRGAVLFDISGLLGRPLQKAVLHLHVGLTRFSHDTYVNAPRDDSMSCAQELGTGTTQWWTTTDWIEADWIDNPSRHGPSVDVDVTTAVRAWMNGAPNYGFVLRGDFEDLNVFRSDTCETTYDSATLTVTHF
jgi:hypothetical protein